MGREHDSVEFLAAFPPISSAIRVSGDLSGMRLLLDVPESEMGNAIAIQMWRNQPLVVTVRLYDENIDEQRLCEQRSEKPTGGKPSRESESDDENDESTDLDPDEAAAILDSYRGKGKAKGSSKQAGRTQAAPRQAARPWLRRTKA